MLDCMQPNIDSGATPIGSADRAPDKKIQKEKQELTCRPTWNSLVRIDSSTPDKSTPSRIPEGAEVGGVGGFATWRSDSTVASPFSLEEEGVRLAVAPS